MAERRMFTDKITDSDAFLDMPASTQCLYFHLNMKADDDGFVNNPKKITRTLNSSEDDLKILLMKRFIIAFESGVIVIKHWRMHNYIRKDRYNATVYQEELDRLNIKNNGSYTLKNDVVNQLDTDCQPNDIQRLPQVRLGKDRLGKDRKDIGIFESYANSNLDLLSALNEFDRMRKSMKKAMTDRAKEMLCVELDKLDATGQNIIACINQSTFHNWQGVFPMKEVMNDGTDTKPDAGNDKWGITTNRL